MLKKYIEFMDELKTGAPWSEELFLQIECKFNHRKIVFAKDYHNLKIFSKYN